MAKAKRKRVGAKRSGSRASGVRKQTKSKRGPVRGKSAQVRRVNDSVRSRKMAAPRKPVPQKPSRPTKARSKQPPRKRSHRAKRQQGSRNKIRALEQRLKREKERVRGLTKVVKDLTQSSRRPIRSEAPIQDVEFTPPAGARVRRDGEFISIELPDYVTDEWAGTDWNFDYDDLETEFGDEEQDQYGEDGG